MRDKKLAGIIKIIDRNPKVVGSIPTKSGLPHYKNQIVFVIKLLRLFYEDTNEDKIILDVSRLLTMKRDQINTLVLYNRDI